MRWLVGLNGTFIFSRGINLQNLLIINVAGQTAQSDNFDTSIVAAQYPHFCYFHVLIEHVADLRYAPNLCCRSIKRGPNCPTAAN